MPENDEARSPQQRPKGRSFSFNLSFGKKPPIDGPRLQELLELSPVDSSGATDDTDLTTNVERFTLEFDEGTLRVNRGESQRGHLVEPPPEDPALARDAEMWNQLGRIAEGRGAYPDTARWHARLSMLVWVIAIALPLTVLVGTIASGESQETIFIMTFGAALVSAMFRSSVR